AAIATATRAGPARATAATGGRLVSLVDGKEYQIPASGVTFGREAGSDVVVAQPEVSRKHATIAPGEGGYVFTDHSTNGVWVNGNRLQGSQVLARADVVRVGGEEFRFYADVAPVAKPASPTPAASAPPVAATPAPTPPAPPPAPPPSPKPVASTPAPATASPPSAPHARPIEPPTAPKAAAPARKKEPPTAPAAPVAAAPAKKGGIPNVVWLIVVVVVIVVTYFLAKG
ncbi:MAG TPA: FHA domain-containing protein, partial [Gemmatimonadaceae bacterium]